MTILDSSHRMVEVAKTLQHSVLELQKLLNAGEVPTSEAVSLVNSAFTALTDVRKELIGAKVAWNEWLGQRHEDGCVYVVIEFGIPKLVPVDGAVPITELAAKSRLPQDKLQRMLRLLATTGVFKETKAGWTHTLMSKALLDESVCSYCAISLEEAGKIRSNIVDYLRDPRAGAMNPWEYTYGIPMYDYYVQNKTRAECFAKAMQGLATAERDPRLLVEFFRSEGVTTAKIVDVGGGSGHVMQSLALHFPGFKYVIQDQNEAMFAEARKKLAGSSLDFEFQVQDFFREQSVKDADYFFVRHILHNWSDEKCRQIIRCLIPAMRAHSQKSGKKCKLLINDSIVPRPGTGDREVERRHRQMDLCMFYVLGTLEREQDQWNELLKELEEDIKISRFIESTHSGDVGLVVLELV